jgi:UDP-GlcNAc:undecaprenyl-phosphate GlcNAc-1-phosphate transferase
MTVLPSLGVVFGASFFVALLLTPLVAILARRLGVVDRPNARKIHAHPIPMMGGLAVLAGLLVGLVLADRLGFIGLADFAPAQGIAIGAVLIFLLGLVDDKIGMAPSWKLLGQILIALLLVAFEIKLSIFIRQNLVITVVTVVWLVGITNSFNLLDNMNGLSSGVGLIAAVFFGWVFFEQGSYFTLGICTALAGALAGFLPHNFPRARIFLGDSGSLLVGFTLAAVSVQGIYLASSKLNHLPIITPILILGVPLFDTLSVILIRLARGLPIFQADKNHFSHRLIDLGMTQKQAVLLIFLVAIAVSIPATLLSHVTVDEALLLLLQELILFVIIVALMRAGTIRSLERERGLPPPDHTEDLPR